MYRASTFIAKSFSLNQRKLRQE